MIDRLKELYYSLTRTQPAPEDTRSTVDQMKEVTDLAAEFDRLQRMPVWEQILKRLGAEVNGELVEATKFKYDPARQVTHTVRWDAKRELLDGLLGWMDATQRERDRIKEEKLDGWHTNDASGI